jgi:hypothetical protein
VGTGVIVGLSDCVGGRDSVGCAVSDGLFVTHCVGNCVGYSDGTMVGSGNVGEAVGLGVAVGAEVGLSVELVRKGSPSVNACGLLPGSTSSNTRGSTKVTQPRVPLTAGMVMPSINKNMTLVEVSFINCR